MNEPQSIIGLVEDVTLPQAVKAMEALAEEYIQYFNTEFITPHIMRFLLEVICPEATPDAKQVAIEKVEELHSKAHAWQVADILRTFLGIAGVSVRNVLSQCEAERQRLRIQRAREVPRVPAVRRRIAQQMENAESDAFRTAKELQHSRDLLNEYTRRIETLEDELHHMRPCYDMSDKFSTSPVGAFIYGTTTPNTAKKDFGETICKNPKIKDDMIISNRNGSTKISNSYNPSRDFVMQAAHQLFAESHAKRTQAVQSDLILTQPLKDEQSNMLEERERINSLKPNMNTKVKESEHDDVRMHTFPLMTPPVSYFLPFKYSSLNDLCDTIPPTSESISAEAFHALITDKRPLCVQEKERADREDSWSQMGKIRLGNADQITGPSAYSRQDGARYLIQVERELTRKLWKM
ncbi:uncharacterized protein TM35_000171630 [Trypanosoma theileri]|uniref:Uncharacterized protein n=1 Tax=Trypanosoma theileri TaxID=67003 RepID=A0A1X0NUK3_9TRYP|nr:uncharacterized protein TM35_000171630 [Trypanosoma theileri]ORC88291.1 hypothetical protein TM35_000171630 [Trypanosoma theileri]